MELIVEKLGFLASNGAGAAVGAVVAHLADPVLVRLRLQAAHGAGQKIGAAIGRGSDQNQGHASFHLAKQQSSIRMTAGSPHRQVVLSDNSKVQDEASPRAASDSLHGVSPARR